MENNYKNIDRELMDFTYKSEEGRLLVNQIESLKKANEELNKTIHSNQLEIQKLQWELYYKRTCDVQWNILKSVKGKNTWVAIFKVNSYSAPLEYTEPSTLGFNINFLPSTVVLSKVKNYGCRGYTTDVEKYERHEAVSLELVDVYKCEKLDSSNDYSYRVSYTTNIHMDFSVLNNRLVIYNKNTFGDANLEFRQLSEIFQNLQSVIVHN